jgi:hypothetical protein
LGVILLVFFFFPPLLISTQTFEKRWNFASFASYSTCLLTERALQSILRFFKVFFSFVSIQVFLSDKKTQEHTKSFLSSATRTPTMSAYSFLFLSLSAQLAGSLLGFDNKSMAIPKSVAN